jgi:membrane protein required for colicin V production
VSLLDLFIGICVAAGIVRGFTAGALRQITSLVALIFVFFLSVSLMRPVGVAISGFLGLSEAIAPLAGFIVAFGLLYGGVLLLVRWAEAVLGWLRLAATNKAAGGLIGGFKAALLLSVGFMVLAYVGVPGEETQRRSSLYEPVSALLPVTWDAVAVVLPNVQDIADQFEHHVNRWPFERE